MPQKPVSPNRPKIFAVVVALAFMAGGGMVFAAEMLNQSIRRSADLFSLIDRQMIVSIPYIATHEEMRRRARKTKRTIGLARCGGCGRCRTFVFRFAADRSVGG